MKLSIALALCALSAPALADVVLTKKVHTDEMQGPQGAVPAKDETQVVWLAKDKLRVEAGPMTYLVRLDKRKLYLLNPAEHTYSALDLPVNLANYVSKEEAQAFEMIKSRFNVSATVTPTGETERIHGWAANKYKLEIHSAGMNSEEIVWTTKDIEVDWSTFWDAQAAVRSLQPGTETLTQELRKTEGVTVKAERTRVMPTGTKIHMVEELLSAERKEAPEGIYDPPSDFTEKPFNAMSELRKMGGARPNAGPGDAPPPRREKKDGDKPTPGGNGGGDDGKGGGEKRRGGGDGKGGG